MVFFFLFIVDFIISECVAYVLLLCEYRHWETDRMSVWANMSDRFEFYRQNDRFEKKSVFDHVLYIPKWCSLHVYKCADIFIKSLFLQHFLFDFFFCSYTMDVIGMFCCCMCDMVKMFFHVKTIRKKEKLSNWRRSSLVFDVDNFMFAL